MKAYVITVVIIFLSMIVGYLFEEVTGIMASRFLVAMFIMGFVIFKLIGECER